MNITEKSTEFLLLLYSKSKGAMHRGYSCTKLQKLLFLNQGDVQSVMRFLSDKEYIDTKSGQGKNVIIKTAGIEFIETEISKGGIKFLKFELAKHLPKTKDGEDWIFGYSIVSENWVSENKQINVSISGSLYSMWCSQLKSNYTDYDLLETLLLLNAKDKIVEKVKEGTLNEKEELILLTTNAPELQYTKEQMMGIEDAEFIIYMPSKEIEKEIKQNKLAASIIEKRDYINAIFSFKYKEKLLMLTQERNLLDFFKEANTEEEFTVRVVSLAEVSRAFNIEALKKQITTLPTDPGSINLLEAFLNQIGKSNPDLIKTFRSFGRIRNGYPSHVDRKELIEGLKHFNLTYPVTDYASAWKTILTSYNKSLDDLFNTLDQ